VETLGNRIKHYRELLGLSQLELSQKSNVSQASIARIESGKQKNLKRETIKKLADGLCISLTELMEPTTGVKEEKAPYTSTRMVPVVKLKDIENIKDLNTLTKKADKYEPTFSSDRNAFYLLITAELTNERVIDEGDMILIEPTAGIKERDMVLYLSSQKKGIGKIYYHHDSLIISPLSQDMPPLVFKKVEKKRHRINIFRISEIKK
jgi:transcriptional regulator with XRE-family HTH domain